MTLNNKQDKDIETVVLKQPIETQKTYKESEESNESDEEIDYNLTFPLSNDSENICETTLDDTINDKLHLPNTEWPNDIYREFMEIVMEYKLSNSYRNSIIKLINNYQNFTNENLLPKNTKKDHKFIDINEFPYMKFKTVPITNFQNIDYNFYYQPIIHGIKVLLLQPDINKEFIYKYRYNDISIKNYGEQFESDW